MSHSAEGALSIYSSLADYTLFSAICKWEPKKVTQLGDGKLQTTELSEDLEVLIQKIVVLFSPQRLISCIFRHNF
jgi:hypothetical protein